MAGEVGDDILRQIGAAHVGDRRRVDDVAGRAAEQTTQESQARFPRPGAERGEPVGADVVVKQLLPAWRAPVSSTVTKGALLSPARSTASSSARKSSSLAVKSRTTWRLEIMSPRPVRSATILSQVIWP